MNELTWGRAELWPWLLWLPVVWGCLHLLLRRVRAAARRYGAGAPRARPARRSAWLTLLFLLGMLCWLDPRYGEETVVVERRGLDVIFCLDTSRSMLAEDLRPSRLERARRDVLSVLPELDGGDRAALVVFAGAARLWVPLTHDMDSFAGLLEQVDVDAVAVGGSDLESALRRALELSDPQQRQTTVVMLLTDGEDLAGAAQAAASDLQREGLLVHAVGYGSARGSKIPVRTGDREQFLRDDEGNEVVSRLRPESLERLAAVTGGEFVRAEALALPLLELYHKRLVPMEKRAYDDGEEAGRKARYQWLLLPLVLLLVLEIAFAHGRHR